MTEIDELKTTVWVITGILSGVCGLLLCGLIGAFAWISNIAKKLQDESDKPNNMIDKPISFNRGFEDQFQGLPRVPPSDPRQDFDDINRSRGYPQQQMPRHEYNVPPVRNNPPPAPPPPMPMGMNNRNFPDVSNNFPGQPGVRRTNPMRYNDRAGY
ncbi:uncharacterized protein LOC109598508 [Aethina tumida]|uniref:uncharacterized protein LOC109598508 n=1 Tax=Aethina tumida TaxID=116153 RepID=UPI00214926B1|nr:uncharacterized protein LOC109598508 [Aethina tumida]